MENQILQIEEALEESTASQTSFKASYEAIQNHNGALVPWRQMLENAVEIAKQRQAAGVEIANAEFIAREWLIDIGIIK